MHLSRLPSGTWRVSVKHAGRRATGSARTRAEAQQVGAELLIEMGATPRATDITVAGLTGAWLASATLSATYRADAVRVIDKLPPAFAERRLTTVTAAVVEHLYRQLAASGSSAHRIRRTHAVLSSAWTLAMRYEWATSNPFSTARKPAAPVRDVHAPSAAEVRAFLDKADDRFRLYLRVAASVGARRGEVVALQWADVGAAEIKIRRALAYTSATGVVETEGKTYAKGHRTVAIPPTLVAELKAWRKEQVGLALAAGLPSPVWVFSHDAGVTPWRPEFASQRFRRIRKLAGTESVRLHDLRHFMASQLLAAGVPVPVISNRLGHANMRTTTDFYRHLIPAADQAASDTMEALLGG